MRLLGTIYTIVLSLTLLACGSNRKTPAGSEILPEDEERIFMLVSAPAAEGDFSRAIAVSDSILSNCVMGDSLKAYIMIERIVAIFNGGDLMGANAYADTLISFGRKAGVNEAVIQGEQVKGVVFRRNEQYDSALTCYTHALDATISDGNIEMEQSIADCIAVLYAETRRNSEALEFAKRSLRLAREMSDTTAIISSISTIGAIYTNEDRFSDVIEELSPYFSMTESLSPPNLIKFLTPLIRSYISLDSIELAKKTIARMEDAVSYLPPQHQANGVVLSAKAALFGQEKRYDEQWKVYLLIDSLGTQGKTKENVFLERAECLAALGKHREAYGKLHDAYKALDSARQVNVEQQLSDLSVRYDTLNKEIEIERLSRQHWILVSGILLCVMLLGLFILIAVSARRRHLRREAQEKQQEYIRGLEQERGRMARELHDDIAGELVGLQCELPDLSIETGAERLGKIAGRVRRLSHELMPPQFASQPFTVLLMDYVRQHNLSNSPARLTVSDEGSFDWSSLSPEHSYELYRIVQEAVSNALHHSSARSIGIILDGNDRFSLSVRNDGVGDGNTSDRDGIGIKTIQARAAIIGASAETVVAGGTFTLTIRQI